MSQLDWYRTFIAVYRAGSVSEAARLRHLTQPAISQQLAALEGVVGVPLFVRTAKGTQPTTQGESLYQQVFAALDTLEQVSRNLKGKATPGPLPPICLGVTPDYFHSVALKRLKKLPFGLNIRFSEPKDLQYLLETGGVDAIIGTLKPSSKSIQYSLLSPKRFVIAGPPNLQKPTETATREELGRWLNNQRWVIYSPDFSPLLRFWQQHLSMPFEAQIALTIPDLRALLYAVELGYGISILPEFLCSEALEKERIQEIYSVRDLLTGEQWFLSFRGADSKREEIQLLKSALSQ